MNDDAIHELDSMIDDIRSRIDIGEPLRTICKLLDLDPNLVRRLDLTATHASVEIYKLRDGKKYIEDHGGPAVTAKTFEVRT